MRIGMFTDTYLPTVDGVVNSILTTKKELKRLGHEVYVFAPEDKKSGIEARENDTFYFKAKEFKSYPGYRIAFFPSRKKNILIKKLGIELLHSHGVALMGLKAMFSAHELKKPLVLTFHTMVTEANYYSPIHLKPDFLLRLEKIYLHRFLSRCDCVITPTRAILDSIKGLCPSMETRVVPTGVDNHRFNPNIDGTKIKKELGLEDNEIILSVGRVAMEKNIELLLDAFPYIKKKKPNAKILVVGEGPAKDYYVKLAIKKGIARDIIFQGFIPDSDLPRYYACSDAFVIPSKFETQGLVILEAMACGKPVAGINYRAVGELIEDQENGFLFEPDNPIDCAQSIINCLECSESIKKKARETAKQYSLENCTKKLVGVYREVLH